MAQAPRRLASRVRPRGVSLLRSRVGGVLALVYAILATYITQDEVRHSHGGWINLRGFGTVLITAPSQLLLGPVLKAIGVSDVNYADLKFADYALLAIHVIVSAIIVYFIIAGLHILAVKLIRVVRRPR